MSENYSYFLKCLLFCTFFCFSVQLFSQPAERVSSITEEFENYDIKVNYNCISYPGDPLFIKLNIIPTKRKIKKLIGSNLICTAEIHSTDDSKKIIRKSDFYQIDFRKKRKCDTLLTGLPTSTFINAGDYSIHLNICAYNLCNETINLPIKILEKEFISETIHLNASNTAIKTNTSKERMNQINRLNEILEKTDKDSIFETTAFIPPTTATRRTSFFADRRIYAYNNGKSSTSLHYGIDYGIPTGSEVRSCGRGKVVMAEDRISTGWSICIEHLPGLYSLYYHLSELNVKPDQIVEKGELIGLSGATGLATGPHLHWEIRLNMEAVNPDFFVNDFAFRN